MIEKKIRAQAREKLNGKWPLMLAAMFTMIALGYLAFLYFEVILMFGNVWDADGKLKPDSAPFLLLTTAVTVAFIFMFSPVKNGLYRLIFNAANNRETEFYDLLYYFKKGRYARTLGFNIVLTLLKLLKCYICFIPYNALNIIKSVNFSTESVPAMDIALTLLFAAGVTGSILLLLKYFITEFLYTEDNNIDFQTNLQITNHIIKRHRGDVYMLWCSFLPWFALCFFVLPAFYVIPYALTSSAVSAKWLLKLYKEGRMI